MGIGLQLRERAVQIYGRFGGKDFVNQGKPLFAATALASLAVYGFHFFVSRRLGVDDYGTVASLISVVTLVNTAAAVGATIIARFAAEFRAVADTARLRRLLDILTVWSAALLIAGAIASFAWRVPLAQFLRIHSPLDMVLAVVLAALTVATVMLRGLLQGMQQFSNFALSFITEQVGRALVASLFVAFGFGVGGALVGSIAAAAIAALYTYGQLRNTLRVHATKLRVDLRRLVTTSGAIALAMLSLAMLSYFDLILAKHYLSSHDAGLYGFAVLPGRALAAVLSFVPTWILPKSAEHAARGNAARNVLLMGVGACCILTVPALAILYFFAPTIVNGIAGAAFGGAAQFIFPYGIAGAIFALTSVATSYQIGRHQLTFAIPLAMSVIAEVAGVAFFHQTAQQIVFVVLASNVLALAASLVRIKR